MTFFSRKNKNKNKKELEYKKTRISSKKKDNFRLWNLAYRIFFYFLMVIFLAVVFFVIFFSPFFAVNKIEIMGMEKIEYREISNVIDQACKNNYWKIFPKKNWLLFPIENISNNLKNDFKRIKNVKIEKKFPNEILVIIEERDPLLLWCDVPEECFIVDSDGFAYQKVKINSREVMENDFMKIMNYQELKITEGQKILNESKVIFLMDVKRIMKDFAGIEIFNEMEIKSPIAGEVILKSKEGWNILINTNFSLEEAGSFLKLFLENKLLIEERTKLEYIDLRVENRIYYKLKKEEQADGTVVESSIQKEVIEESIKENVG